MVCCTPLKSHELANLSFMARAFKTCADELIQLLTAHPGETRAAPAARIAHPRQIGAFELL